MEERLTVDQGVVVYASLEALRCVLEQDILSSAKYWFNIEDPSQHD